MPYESWTVAGPWFKPLHVLESLRYMSSYIGAVLLFSKASQVFSFHARRLDFYSFVGQDSSQTTHQPMHILNNHCIIEGL